MIININSGSSGWGNYVLYGTKDKPRDNSKVELLDGDISLGDYYSKNNKYEDSYYTVVLGFKGKPSKEVIESAYSDFKEQFFKGFRQDEYHIDAVIHYDTDDTHIHARIPKQNLLTNTHLQLYYDKIDRPRKELIQDYISLKYGLEIARETNREIVKEQSHEYINKWREERKQEPFNFSNKKGKDLAEKQINSYISDLITSNLIEKREDITTILEELGLEVIKENGLDIKKDFAYATVQNETGKMRIKGEFYNDRFWQHNEKDRRTQIESNKRITEHTEPNHERFTRVQRELRKANEKRYNRVTELFRVARERAINEIKATTSKAIEINRETIRRELGNNREFDKSTNNKNISNSIDIRDNNRGNINDNHNRRLIDDTVRTTTYERDRAVRKERARTLREARNARNEILDSIRESHRGIQDTLRERQDTLRAEQERIRELAGRTKQLIQTSKSNERNINKFTKLREFGRGLKNAIASTKQLIKDKVNRIINYYNKKFHYDSKPLINAVKELQSKQKLGSETTLKDIKGLEKTFNNELARDTIKHQNQRKLKELEKTFDEIKIDEIKIDTKTKHHQNHQQQDWGLHR